MSYVELYNERLYDLLLPRGNDLAIREDKAKNIFIPDLTEVMPLPLPLLCLSLSPMVGTNKVII